MRKLFLFLSLFFAFPVLGGSFGEIQNDGAYSIQGLWHLNDNSSSESDSSGNSNTGTVTGATYTTSGKFGGAYNFDAVSETISISANSTIDTLFATGGSLLFWAVIDSGGSGNTTGRILYKLDATTGWQLFVRNEDVSTIEIKFVVKFSTDDGKWYIGDVLLDTWVQIAIIYDGSSTSNDVVMYINGESATAIEETAPSGAIMTDTGVDLYIGNNFDTDRGFDGLIDEIVIWDRALSASEIRQLYQMQRGGYSIIE